MTAYLHELSRSPHLPRLLSDLPAVSREALRHALREIEDPVSVPETPRRRRGEQYDDRNRILRTQALMPAPDREHYPAAEQACIEDLVGANLVACTRRVVRKLQKLG
jgi:primosomal protein N''